MIEINKLKEYLLTNNLSATYNFLYIPAYIRDIEKYPYHQVIENDSTSLGIITKYIKETSKVLDVGCGSGYLGEYLINKKRCVVDGIDINEGSLKRAKGLSYRYTFLFDLDCEVNKIQKIEDEYDYVVCADVLEHLKNVNDVTLKLFDLVKEGGELLVSIPNVGHLDIVYNLLRGKFNYSYMGLLDNTHVRFFTQSSFEEWIKLLLGEKQYECKLIATTKYSQVNFLEEDEVELLLKMFRKILIRIGKEQDYKQTLENLFTFQFIFSIKKVG